MLSLFSDVLSTQKVFLTSRTHHNLKITLFISVSVWGRARVIWHIPVSGGIDVNLFREDVNERIDE